MLVLSTLEVMNIVSRDGESMKKGSQCVRDAKPDESMQIRPCFIISVICTKLGPCCVQPSQGLVFYYSNRNKT